MSMAEKQIEPPVAAADVSLKHYYLIGIFATTLGIFVVAVLNLFTPLESIKIRIFGTDQALTMETMLSFFFPKLLVVLGISYLGILYMIQRMLGPVSRCLAMMKKGEYPDKQQVEAAQRRLLNMPFLFVPWNVFLWILIPALVGVSSVLTGIVDLRTAVILSVRASMVGLVASAIASQKMESIARRQLIPFFFPDGRLTQLKGAAKISISRRIILVNRLGAVIPMTILLVTLLTLQWYVETDTMSAVRYGRGILLFTFVLFIYTLVSSKHLNRLLSSNITDPINDLVRVLQQVQKGTYTTAVQVLSNDEIGYAGEVVNEMAAGLKEKQQMQKSLNLAREIQQNLLPGKMPDIPGFDIACTTSYCDETGGDFYDVVLPEGPGKNTVQLVLGDVSGHGVSSALLMATARALFRQRSAMGGTLDCIVGDVNRQLCQDVRDSGDFMTMIVVEINAEQNVLKWVRAGQDPAVLYDASADRFTNLKGPGIALGLDETFQYTENTLSGLSKGDVLALFSDGIWEAKNVSGSAFGKENLKQMIQQNAQASANEIRDRVMAALTQFQGSAKRQDDASLVIIKKK